jgi:acyl-[acyl-carrier-protein]-phospholipid O-acyltransferase/long-chain-fatty-acid--[acyl-carrier-protein] ligase
MIPFAINILHLTDVQGGYLFLLTALGIGGGSLLAGKLSGKAVELGLVPIGGVGITLCCFALDYWSESLPAVLAFVFLVGFFGGIYLVPLDSYVQITAPKIHRGQIVATSNFFGFVGVLLSAATLYVLSDVLHLDADHGFTLMGFATLGILVFILISMSGYIVRFCSYIVSRIHFPVSLKHQDDIPISKVSFYFVPHSFWPWAAVLLASQRKRMRLFTIQSDPSPTYLGRLAKRFIPVLEVDKPEDLLPNGEYGELIEHSATRGTSVGIFCSKELFSEYVRRWHSAWQGGLQDKEIQFFSLVAVGQEKLTEGKMKTKLAAEITRLSSNV